MKTKFRQDYNIFLKAVGFQVAAQQWKNFYLFLNIYIRLTDVTIEIIEYCFLFFDKLLIELHERIAT